MRSLRVLDDDRQTIIKLAYINFKFIFIMTEPWVAWGDADNFADDAWEIACLEADINVDALVPDKAVRNLVSL